MQTIAYAELRKTSKFVIPGMQLKLRRVSKDRNGRALTFGSFRIEGQDQGYA